MLESARMGEFKEFLAAVIGSWVETVGIVLTILFFVERLPPIRTRLQQRPLIDRFAPLLWIVGVFCISWGFYSAWLNEHRSAQALRLELEAKYKPKLIGEFDQWCFAEVEGNPNSSFVFV
jgi:hypothetical protein